jgi:CheY-like chemotaxis protein
MEKKIILLIDDDQDDVELFVEAVKQLNKNIEIEIAYNSLKALNDLKIAAHLPDFIFLDMQMPYLSGQEFLNEIAQIPRLNSIRIIVYSSHTTSTLQQLVKHSSQVSYITKPYSFSELVKMLDELL